MLWSVNAENRISSRLQSRPCVYCRGYFYGARQILFAWPSINHYVVRFFNIFFERVHWKKNKKFFLKALGPAVYPLADCQSLYGNTCEHRRKNFDELKKKKMPSRFLFLADRPSYDSRYCRPPKTPGRQSLFYDKHYWYLHDYTVRINFIVYLQFSNNLSIRRKNQQKKNEPSRVRLDRLNNNARYSCSCYCWIWNTFFLTHFFLLYFSYGSYWRWY